MALTKTQDEQTVWFEVPIIPDERPVDRFTDEILDYPQAGNWICVLFHWLKLMKGGFWSPADPANPNKEHCCVGTVEKMTVANDGDIVIYVKPDPDCKDRLMNENEDLLVCELPWSIREEFREDLKQLKGAAGTTPGTKIQICGHWIIDHGHPTDHTHELHPVTALLVLE